MPGRISWCGLFVADWYDPWLLGSMLLGLLLFATLLALLITLCYIVCYKKKDRLLIEELPSVHHLILLTYSFYYQTVQDSTIDSYKYIIEHFWQACKSVPNSSFHCCCFTAHPSHFRLFFPSPFLAYFLSLSCLLLFFLYCSSSSPSSALLNEPFYEVREIAQKVKYIEFDTLLSD